MEKGASAAQTAHPARAPADVQGTAHPAHVDVAKVKKNKSFKLKENAQCDCTEHFCTKKIKLLFANMAL